MRESFRFFSSFLDTARAIEDDKLRCDYLMAVAEYGLEWKQPTDAMVNALMAQTRFAIDRSNEISLSASERWKKGWAPKWNSNAKKNWENDVKQPKQANSSKNKQNQTKTSEVEYIDNKLSITLDKSNVTININNLIEELKKLANSLGIAYDNKDERNFSRHILKAKAFVDLASNLAMTPTELAKNIMLASVKIWYWKWPCNWPKAIYQNYAEVYNQTVAKSRKVAVTTNEWVF